MSVVEESDTKSIVAIFHKCTSHSEFLNVMLSNSPLKGTMRPVLGRILTELFTFSARPHQKYVYPIAVLYQFVKSIKSIRSRSNTEEAY